MYGYGFARQVYEAQKKGPNSEEWTNEVWSALSQHTVAWSGLAKNMGIGIDENEEESAGEEIEPTVNVTPNPADLMGGDSILIEAQRLADQGRYELAIQKIESISESSPMYNDGLEKIKEFSNLAVQKLRKQAAQAYKDAMVDDKKIELQNQR